MASLNPAEVPRPPRVAGAEQGPRPPRGSRVLASPLAVFSSFWTHRHLLLALVRRDILSRYRGSFLGLAWAFLSPIALLMTFTFVFGTIFESRWDVELASKIQFALLLFAGLIAFWFFSDCVSRAPGIVLENSSYVKRVRFPLEILPWVIVLSALFQAALNSLVLLGAYVVVLGVPSATAWATPVLLVPLLLATLGISWLFASVGVYVRDLRQFVPVLTTLMMFLAPLFYPLSAVPEGFRRIILLNPLSWVVESIRGALFFGQLPDLGHLLVVTLCGWLMAWFGLLWFRGTRKGFADVV